MNKRVWVASLVWVAMALLLGVGGSVGTLTAQEAVSSQVISAVRGTSVLVMQPNRVERISIGDPKVADAIAVSPSEVLVNALSLGSTTLIVWDAAGGRRLYTVEVTADAASLTRQLNLLFPGEPISVNSTGNMVILSGRVGEASVARRALDIAKATGATVIDNLTIPPARQIMLQVRFAEVTRRASEHYGVGLEGAKGGGLLHPESMLESGDRAIETLSDGLVKLFFFEDDFQLGAIIEAMRQKGTFRSLAEPNLLALEGREASFLAGGEFPYPVPQGGDGNQVTIAFKEFGVRLKFTPNVTIAGNIRLKVAPEVSSLDFANGLQYSGFQIPSLLTRRAETEVELKPGQTFAIAGLMDNVMQNTNGRIPFLGDLPILGAFFRSKDAEQRRTELLVLVTPVIVEGSSAAPAVPTGEPADWGLSPHLEVPAPTPTRPLSGPGSEVPAEESGATEQAALPAESRLLGRPVVRSESLVAEPLGSPTTSAAPTPETTPRLLGVPSHLVRR